MVVACVGVVMRLWIICPCIGTLRMHYGPLSSQCLGFSGLMMRIVVDLLFGWRNWFGKKIFFCLEFNPIMPVVGMVERGIIILLKMRKLDWFIRSWFSLGCCLNSLVFIHSIVDSFDFLSVLVVILNFCIL